MHHDLTAHFGKNFRVILPCFNAAQGQNVQQEWGLADCNNFLIFVTFVTILNMGVSLILL